MLEACDRLPSDDIHTKSLASDDKKVTDTFPALTPSSGQTNASQAVSMDLVDFDWVSRCTEHISGGNPAPSFS
jgi:hypothetical protein